MARHQPYMWERMISLLAGAVAIGVVLFVIVRNEPFRDPNLVVALRILLSFSVSLLGGTIPGFLSIDWSGGGIALRAGGALALFVLTYFGTPVVLKPLEIAPVSVRQETKEACSQNINGISGGTVIISCGSP